MIVDTGFDEKAGKPRRYAISRPVAEGLKQIDVKPERQGCDFYAHALGHAGNHDPFPQARYHVQEREMHFCTGRCMCDPMQKKAYNAEDISHIVRRNFEGRVTLHNSNSNFDDGISLHWMGGHTAKDFKSSGSKRGGVTSFSPRTLRTITQIFGQLNVDMLTGCVSEGLRKTEKEALDCGRSFRDLDNRAGLPVDRGGGRFSHWCTAVDATGRHICGNRAAPRSRPHRVQ